MKNLTDLTQEELKSLFKANKHLQEQAQNNLLEDAYYCIDEYLTPFYRMPGVEYSISCYYDYFTVKSPDYYFEFLEGVGKMQKDFCLLSDDTIKLFERAADKVEFFEECYNGYEDISDKRYYQLEKWIKNIVDRITSEILKNCQDEIMYCYDYDNQEGYFLDNLDIFDYETDGEKVFATVCYA